MTESAWYHRIVDLLGVATVAIALRLVPLYYSYLPFNTDGFGYVALAETLTATGHVPFASMATDSLGFTALLSAVSMFTGQPPLHIAQPMSALVGGFTAVVGLVVARRIATDLGWGPFHVRSTGVLAGLFLAVNGVYLYRTTPTDEQTLGLLLVPFVALALHRGFVTGEFRWGVGTLLGLAVLPSVHNLSSLVGALVVTIVVVLHTVGVGDDETRRGPLVGIAFLTVVWVYTIGFHPVVHALTGAAIVQTERLTAAPGLLIAWVVLLSIGLAWYVRTTARFQRGLVLGIVGVAYGVFTLNAVVTIYPGTMTTQPLLLAAIVPLVVLVVFAGYAIPWVTDRLSDGGVIVLALAGTVVALVGFSLTAALTFPYITMLFRSHLFVYLPLAVLAALGAVAVSSSRRSSIGAVLAVGVLVCAGVSAPLVTAGLPLVPFETITTPPEFEATEFASTSVPGEWATDGHLRRVSGYFDGGGSLGPVRTWLSTGGPPPACPTLAKTSWTITGAQVYPRPPPTIDPAQYDRWTAVRNVVYGTTHDEVRLVIPRSPGNASC